MVHGICHVDIPCRDIARARSFYGRVFGWTFDDFGEDYVLFKTGGEVGGGLEQWHGELPAERGVTLYVEVEDIAHYLKKVSEAGGRVVKEKTKIGEKFGYYGLFTDSEGNTLGLWSRT